MQTAVLSSAPETTNNKNNGVQPSGEKQGMGYSYKYSLAVRGSITPSVAKQATRHQRAEEFCDCRQNRKQHLILVMSPSFSS